MSNLRVAGAVSVLALFTAGCSMDDVYNGIQSASAAYHTATNDEAYAEWVDEQTGGMVSAVAEDRLRMERLDQQGRQAIADAVAQGEAAREAEERAAAAEEESQALARSSSQSEAVAERNRARQEQYQVEMASYEAEVTAYEREVEAEKARTEAAAAKRKAEQEEHQRQLEASRAEQEAYQRKLAAHEAEVARLAELRRKDAERNRLVEWKEGVAVCEQTGEKSWSCKGPRDSSSFWSTLEANLKEVCGNARSLGTQGRYQIYGCGYGINPKDDSPFREAHHYDWIKALGLTSPPGRRTYRCKLQFEHCTTS